VAGLVSGANRAAPVPGVRVIWEFLQQMFAQHARGLDELRIVQQHQRLQRVVVVSRLAVQTSRVNASNVSMDGGGAVRRQKV
jgi:hypothetical protein